MFAENTSVPVERTQGEIKKILSKYQASAFAFAENIETGMVQFEMKERRIKFLLPLGVRGKSKNKRGYIMDEKSLAQFNRSRWRGLLLAIKAKLECVESGITTLEQEFMAHIVLPNGKTIHEEMGNQIQIAYTKKQMPPLLGMR